VATNRLMGVRPRGIWVALAAISVAATGCDTGSESLLPGTTTEAAASMGAEQEFARVLALALKQPDVRALLHRAMQESRFNEHKLVLQTFLETRDGARLASAMAAAGGVDEGQVRGWAARLPAMDFYVPFVEHRRNWTGGADVVVGANMDVDQSKFTGYTPEGGRIAFDARTGTPRQTVVFLHPAEPKGIRPSSGPRTGDGRVIQDASEADAPLLLNMDPDQSCDPQTALLPCPDDGGSSGGGGGGGGGTTVPTYTATLVNFKNYTGDGIGGIELLVKHYAGNWNGTKIEQKLYDENMHWSWEGYYWDDVTTVNSSVRMASNTTTYIKVYERDSGAESWFGTDDYWGEGLFGGFGFRHRFYSHKNVEYIYSNDPCYLGNGCGTDATVDIVYRQ